MQNGMIPKSLNDAKNGFSAKKIHPFEKGSPLQNQKSTNGLQIYVDPIGQQH